MRILEVRRHTMRRKPGAHLSQDGIFLARLVGSTAGPFSRVVTSPIPRAVETAIAMGYEVHETLDALGHLPEDVFKEVGWRPNSFTRFAQAIALGGSAAKFAGEQARLWQSIVAQIPDSQQALIITHGGFVELGAVACLPEADHGAWGGVLGYCEGVRLSFDGECRSCEILRVPEAYHLLEN
jgi:broad specificity phosphatase PhoE